MHEPWIPTNKLGSEVPSEYQRSVYGMCLLSED